MAKKKSGRAQKRVGKKKKRKASVARVGTKRLSAKVAKAVEPIVQMSGRTGALNGPVLALMQPIELAVGTSHTVSLNPAQRVTLLAAAPELYRACQSAAQLLRALRLGSTVQDELEEALKKAYQG